MALKANQRFFDVQNETQETFLPIEGYADMPLLSIKMSVENLGRIISKVIQNASTATERSTYPANGLTQDESASICLYTMDSKSNDQSLCVQLNIALRSNDRSELVPYFFYLKLFLTALWKLKSVRKRVWRGVKADLSDQYPVGKTVVWSGFSSCIESFDLIQSDKFIGKRGKRTLFEIECETGKAINQHSYYHDIDEILLLPGIHLQVIDQTHSIDGLCIIHLKEIKLSLPFLQSSFTSSTLNNSTKRNENKVYSAPISSFTRSATNLLSSERSKSFCSTSPSPSRSSKVMKKTTKAYENKILKELIKKENKTDSIRFSKQLLNYDDMEIIADELISNKCWKMIYLWENYLNYKHMEILTCSLKLNSTVVCLSLDCNLLGDEGASIIASALKINTSIRSLYLNNNQIGDIGGEELSNMLFVNKTLTHLELSSNCIGDVGIIGISNALKINEYLRTICLNDNKINEIGGEHLGNMLEINKTLTDLQLSSNPIGDNGVTAIAHALQKNMTLESLNISQTNITMNSIDQIGKMIKINNMLKSLYLNNNNIGDDELIIIVSSLMENRTITTLDLSMNNLTEISGNEIGCLLKQEEATLTTLILNENPLGDIGITSIASALINNTTLNKLIIESIDMTIEGVRELSIMLCFNKDLHYLNLNNNDIDDYSMNLIGDALQYNKTLQYLYLNNCNLKDECVPFIVDIMKQSKTLISIELVKNHLTERGKKAINEAAMLYKGCGVYLDFSFRKVH